MQKHARYPFTADERVGVWDNKIIILFHLVALLCPVLWYAGAVEFSWTDIAVAFGRYWFGMFCVTAGYHRYFAHRAFKFNKRLERPLQFLLALGAQITSQKGVLWWAAHHRHHHKFSDMAEDTHSPLKGDKPWKGFLWSQIGWILCPRHKVTHLELIRDYAKYPELMWLNKYWQVPPLTLGVAMFLIGGMPMLLMGFFVSTVVLWHGTFTINSLTHIPFGRLFTSRPYETTDTSYNNWLLAIITMGEGWHNNHHHYQSSAAQSFTKGQRALDWTYWILWALWKCRVVAELRPVPDRVAHGGEGLRLVA